MDELISVIVPVYNAEAQVDRCIRSLVEQTYPNLEILLVDDGSTDGSYAICRGYAERYGNIRVFQKKNGGVSSARNLGLDQAKGEFLFFLDSDDYLDPACLEKLAAAQKESGAEIVVSNALDEFDGGRTEIRSSGEMGVLLNREEAIYHFLKEDLYTAVCWGRLYARANIASLRFDESMRIAEDGKFFLGAIQKSSCIYVIPERYYYYYIREGSAVHSGFTEKYFDTLGFCEEMARDYQGVPRLGEAAAQNLYGFVRGLLERKDLPAEAYRKLLPRAKKAYQTASPYLSVKKKVKFMLLCNPVLRRLVLRG